MPKSWSVGAVAGGGNPYRDYPYVFDPVARMNTVSKKGKSAGLAPWRNVSIYADLIR